MRSPSWLLLPPSLLASIVSATNHIVTVGKDSKLKFDPETLPAVVGDTITYHFFAKNHSVVQSSFDDPCHPLDGGFFSAFTPNEEPDVASPTTWTISVNDTKPIWVYCSQTTGDHCQKGMVHAVNAPSSGNTFDAYKSKAAEASTSSSPSDGLPVGGLRVVKVDVGSDGELAFTPNDILEPVGTIVEFSFNPKNHSVVQSSFDDPCHPLDDGFSSGFIPTGDSPSGVLFDVVIEDTKPIWFYCAQTAKTHCQSGMVGAINAAAVGNNLAAFEDKAASASASTIAPHAPLGGVLTINGTVVPSLNGAVLDSDTALDDGAITDVPPPGANMSAYVWGMAGGGQPASYNWAPTISDNATHVLQLLQFLDNILLEVLFDGFAKLSAGGAWAGLYPPTIVDTIGTMSAQALVHRATATDSLQHFDKDLVEPCTLHSSAETADGFLGTALKLLLLEIGVLLDGITHAAATDPWVVPALAAALGAKSRMAGVVNLMQGHTAAAAVREAAIPSALAWSYAKGKWVDECPGSELGGVPDEPIPSLTVVAAKTVGTVDRLAGVRVEWEAEKDDGGNLFIAWIGPWGGVEFTPLGDNGTSPVPMELYGHVWAVLVSKGEGKLADLAGMAVAGPELVWVGQPHGEMK